MTPGSILRDADSTKIAEKTASRNTPAIRIPSVRSTRCLSVNVIRSTTKKNVPDIRRVIMQELVNTWQPYSTFSIILLSRFTQSRTPSKGSFGCFPILINRKRPTRIKIAEAANATDTMVPAFRILQGKTPLANGLDGEQS